MPVVIGMLAQGMAKGLQCEMDDFFGKLAGSAGFVRQASKSAFSQARRKLKSSAFGALNTLLLDTWYAHVKLPRWHGFRLVAGDTTMLRLPPLPEVVERFGCHSEVPMAQVIGLFDVASKVMLHAQLAPAAARERSMLADCVDHLDDGDLLLLDRGFPAYWLFAWLAQHRRHFCIRVDGIMMKEMEAAAYGERANDSIVELTVPPNALRTARANGYAIEQATTRVRLIRVPLKSGTIEYLATSLLDADRYPAHEFAALYHQRWRIEESFKLLKCRLAMEHFSGELPDCIEQDFLAKLWLGNVAATFAWVASHAADHAKAAIPNLTYAISALRSVLPRLMLLSNASASLQNLLHLIACTVEPPRPDRSFPRTRQKVEPRKHRAYKGLR